MTSVALPISVIELGVTAPDDAVDFLRLFGGETFSWADTSASVHHTVSFGRGARVDIHRVETEPTAPTGFDLGPRAIDIYTSDLDAAIDGLDLTESTLSPIAEIASGPVRMRQVMVTGPDAIQIVLVESTHRQPSLLDGNDDRLFSEIHSVVWCVPDRDEEAARWVDAGFTQGADRAFAEPSVAPYLALPVPPGEAVPVELVMLGDARLAPTRLELLSFPGVTSTNGDASPALRALRFDPDGRVSAADLPAGWLDDVSTTHDGTTQLLAGRTAAGIDVVVRTG
jgi:hypothetical protein